MALVRKRWLLSLPHLQQLQSILQQTTTKSTISSYNNDTNKSNQTQKQKLWFCSSSSSSSDEELLVTRLIQAPTHQVKSTLDVSLAHFTLKSFQLSLDTLLCSILPSSPHKFLLVLEWVLERLMLDHKDVDHEDYSILIRFGGKILNISFPMRVFTSMEARGITPATLDFNSLIDACFLCNQVVTALSLFEVMQAGPEECRPDSVTYDVFVSGFSGLRDVNRMKVWFQAKKVAGFYPIVRNYESLIYGCIKENDFDGADWFYDEMVALGFSPTIPILESMIEGVCKQRDCDRVNEYLKSLLQCGFDISANMIEIVVRLYSQLGKLEEMEKLLRTFMEFNHVDEALHVLHCGIIRSHAILDRLDDVEYSLGRMMSLGMSFRSSGDVEKVISCFFRKEAYDRLDLFLEHLKGRYKLQRSTYDLLVAGYRRAGLTEKLNLLMKDMDLAS